MEYDMITNRHCLYYEYITLCDINIRNIPDTIEVDSLNLVKKKEFHISLVCLKHLAPIVDFNNTEVATKKLLDSFVNFEKDHDLVHFSLTGKYRLVKKDSRVSVVAMIDMPVINDLFDYLSKETGVILPVQPTHITIYGDGIGLLSDGEVESISQSVDIPELNQITVN